MAPLTQGDKDFLDAKFACVEEKIGKAQAETKVFVIDAVVKAVAQHRLECSARKGFTWIQRVIIAAAILGGGGGVWAVIAKLKGM